MSRRDSLPAVERRLKRIAGRHGLNLLKPQKPDAQVLRHGGYMLRDEETARIVFGDAEYRFCADIDEIEAYLLKLEGDRLSQD